MKVIHWFWSGFTLKRKMVVRSFWFVESIVFGNKPADQVSKNQLKKFIWSCFCLDTRIQTSESSSRGDFLRRFRIWGPNFRILASRGQNLRKTTYRKISKKSFLLRGRQPSWPVDGVHAAPAPPCTNYEGLHPSSSPCLENKNLGTTISPTRMRVL